MKKLFFSAALLFLTLGGAVYFGFSLYRETHVPEEYVPTDWALVNVVGTNSTGYTYISYLPKSLKTKGDVVQIDEDYELKLAHAKPTQNYPSVIFTKEYNCKTKEFRLTSFTVYSEAHAGGEMIASSREIKAWAPSAWTPIKSDAPESIFYPIFCSK